MKIRDIEKKTGKIDHVQFAIDHGYDKVWAYHNAGPHTTKHIKDQLKQTRSDYNKKSK